MAALVIIFGVLAVGTIAISWAASKPPPRSIPEICREVMRERLPGIVSKAFNDIMAEPEFAYFRFIKQIQFHLQQADPTLADKRAFEMAKNVYWTNLADEKVAFGDPAFAWDSNGARELAEAYEMDHWERVS